MHKANDDDVITIYTGVTDSGGLASSRSNKISARASEWEFDHLHGYAHISKLERASEKWDHKYDYHVDAWIPYDQILMVELNDQNSNPAWIEHKKKYGPKN